MTDRPPINSTRLASPQPSRDVRSLEPGSRRRTHPLLGAFPLAIMALATFLIVFTLMMARLRAGADPALRGAGASVLNQPAASPASITTRASGGGSASGTALAVSQGSPQNPVIVTRSSTSAAGGSHDD